LRATARALELDTQSGDTAAAPARALVTGAAGFAGRHLLDFLASETGWELFGNVHAIPTRYPGVDRVRWVTADLTEREQAASMVGEVRPEYVVHLAAQSNVQVAFKDPEATIMNNVVGQ